MFCCMNYDDLRLYIKNTYTVFFKDNSINSPERTYKHNRTASIDETWEDVLSND